MGFSNSFDSFMFGALPFAVFTIFAIVAMVFMTSLVRGLGIFFRNNGKPLVQAPARVIGKRTHVWGGNGNPTAHTSYYVTFELENGERIEMPVNGRFFGMHVEGDAGTLSYRGTRFCGFEREGA